MKPPVLLDEKQGLLTGSLAGAVLALSRLAGRQFEPSDLKRALFQQEVHQLAYLKLVLPLQTKDPTPTVR